MEGVPQDVAQDLAFGAELLRDVALGLVLVAVIGRAALGRVLG